MNMQERILAAAAELIRERTIDDLNISVLSRKLGVSRQTIYRHVGGIEQLKQLLAEIPGLEVRSRDTRSRILASAYRVFSDLGFSGASLDQIAEDAGLTKGAVYWHFSSKNDLFLALFDLRLSKLNDIMPDMSQLAIDVDNPQETLTALLEAQLAFALADPHWPRLYLEFLAQSRDADIQQKLTAALQSIQHQTGELIRYLQEAGLISRQIQAGTLASLFISILDGIVLGRLCNAQPEPVQVLAKEIANILYNGISYTDPICNAN